MSEFYEIDSTKVTPASIGDETNALAILGWYEVQPGYFRGLFDGAQEPD